MLSARRLVGLLLATSIPHALAPAPFDLPAPTGRYPVGTTTWRLSDDARQETFSGPGVARQVEVTAWYPRSSSRGTARAPYLRGGLPEARGFAALVGLPAGTFDALADVRTHADVDAPPSSAAGPMPVLVFSHGYLGSPSAYTALIEDLASHGYAVLNIAHPYEATAATLADGTVVSQVDAGGTLRAPIRELLDEWRAEDDTLAAVTGAPDDSERLRLLRGYFGGLPRTSGALHRWVDDTKLVLDRLDRLPAGSPGARLSARLDMSRLGVLGHSMGGVTAGQFCVEDRRCRAGLNLDGSPQSGTMIDTPMPGAFLMVYSGRPGRAGASDVVYRRSASRYYRVDVRDTKHLDFSDTALWPGPLRERGALGVMAPARACEITRAIVLQYFDQELRGRRSPLLAGSAAFPEVSVTTSVRAAPGRGLDRLD